MSRPPPATRRESVHGFTLVEVLLAIVLLGVSLTIFLDAANQSLAFISDARDYERARNYLQILELREPLDLENLEESRDGGTLNVDGPARVAWTREVTEVGKEEDELFHIHTEVSWGRDSVFRESVDTYLHLPNARAGGWVREPAD